MPRTRRRGRTTSPGCVSHYPVVVETGGGCWKRVRRTYKKICGDNSSCGSRGKHKVPVSSRYRAL